MSRSYKKHPFCKDWNRRKRVGKQLANRKVRAQLKRGIEIPSGKAYRKVFELEEAIDDWEKYYYRK